MSKTPRGIVMPAELVYLMEHGHLYAAEAETLGVRPDRCAYCEAPLDLIWLHPVIPSVAEHRGVLPGSGCGTDIAALCRCCSTADCPHCWWHGALVMGHAMDAAGTCARCGRKGLKVAA